MKLLTLGLPIHNPGKFLEDCLLSIQRQTYAEFKVIAVLDGCTDSSEEILNDYKDPRFSITKLADRCGLAAVLNLIIERAETPLIARMDADDTMEPARLEKQLLFLQANPDVDILGTWLDYIYADGTLLRDAFPFPADHTSIVSGFKRYNAIAHPTTVYRTDSIQKVQGYDARYPVAQDLALWLKCMVAGLRFANLPEVLYHYRQHSQQASSARRAEQLRITNLLYREFGPQIWPDDPPDILLGASIPHRILRRIKRLLHIR